jgi:hypothetical protein
MCKRTSCPTCHKPSWSGCGAHVEQVLGDVPRNQRCACREQGKAASRRSATRAGAPTTPTTSTKKRSLRERLGLG